MDIAARIHRTAFDHALPSLAGLHTPDEDRWFFRERVYSACEVWGAFDGGAMTGIIAARGGWIDQLYVLPQAQRCGVGTELLQVAQARFDPLNSGRSRPMRWQGDFTSRVALPSSNRPTARGMKNRSRTRSTAGPLPGLRKNGSAPLRNRDVDPTWFVTATLMLNRTGAGTTTE
ncbi:MAG TPA: GNAT family N-acetyltransferase [Bradyrhizobium sp.]